MDKFECDRVWASNEERDDGNTVNWDDEGIGIRLRFLYIKYSNISFIIKNLIIKYITWSIYINLYHIWRCPVPCEFGRISVFEKFFDKKFYIKNYTFELNVN